MQFNKQLLCYRTR
ncbi:hypothetical protein CAJAP_04266 [Camponotus japonicus]